jgi:hypothetical protein
VLTNNPDTTHRYRLVARHVGATVEEVVKLGGGLTRLVFNPPPPRSVTM